MDETNAPRAEQGETQVTGAERLDQAASAGESNAEVAPHGNDRSEVRVLTLTYRVVRPEPERPVSAYIKSSLVKRLKLAAFLNKQARTEPATIKAILVEAIEEWLDRHDFEQE